MDSRVPIHRPQFIAQVASISSLGPELSTLLDRDQPLLDLSRRCVGIADQLLQLYSRTRIATFDALLLTVSDELRILEGVQHRLSQRRESLRRDAWWRSDGTAGNERRRGGGQQRLVGGVGDEVGCVGHVLEIRMRVCAILE